MLETMIEAAHEIAKRSGIDLLFLITKEDVDEDAFSFEILQAPKSYATILESLVYHTDDSDITIFEKYLQTYRISEYISTLTYFKSIEIKKAVVVVYTEPLKAIFIFEPEKSN
ncbi:MAG: diadenylate cyclase, partial [Archaeoglobaceae archaeon]